MNTETLPPSPIVNPEIGYDMVVDDALTIAEPQEPSPVVTLTAAQMTASLLAVAGASDNIRYAAKKATEMLGRLLRDLEHHRRLIGGPVV
jgi:hypothetical protein